MLKTILILLTASLVLALSGCNTVKGVGKDIHDSAAGVQTWLDGDTQ